MELTEHGLILRSLPELEFVVSTLELPKQEAASIVRSERENFEKAKDAGFNAMSLLHLGRTQAGRRIAATQTLLTNKLRT